MVGTEQNFIADAFNSNWIAPNGPNVIGFENDLKAYLGGHKHIVALNTGTSSLHLALELLNVSTGDEVICQSFTFTASANPITYLGAVPVFVDSETDTWNMSPELLEVALEHRIKHYKKPKAIIVVDLYGMPHKSDEINAIASKFDIPLIEDSAGALGSTYFGEKCGTLSSMGILSFNGNKIITTSAGGALIVNQENIKDKAIFLSTQAKDNAPHYEHSSIGYNYRMSNVLAGIGRGQIEVIDERVNTRRKNFKFYKDSLSEFDFIEFLKEPKGFLSNRWITCMLTNSYELREKIRISLLKDKIESRPLWKPLHLQPIFKDCLCFLNGVSEDLFNRGLCLPSGSNLSDDDLNRIINNIFKTLKQD